MGRELCFKSEQNKRSQEQGDSGEPQRQQIESKYRKNDKDDSHNARNYGARMVELRINGSRADDQNQEGNVRIHHESEDLLLQRHVIVDHLGCGGMKDLTLPVKAFDGLAIELLQQIGRVLSDIIDQVLLKRFLVGERFRLTDRAFGNLNIPKTFGNE